MVAAILAFFVGHWFLSAFFQSFFLHRYGAHRQFTMNKVWERVFYLGTFCAQGTSFLVPRSYAVLHRLHHAFSDRPGDPHSPHVYPNLLQMMMHTASYYRGVAERTLAVEKRFEGWSPEWKWLDRVGDHWGTRIGWGVAYTAFYFVFSPHWAFFLLLPIHFMMGPVHGAIVNWCGHKYGYRNYDSADHSRNTLPIDFLIVGELYQNNHHRFGQSPNFAKRWFEFDATYLVIRVLAALRILQLQNSSAAAA